VKPAIRNASLKFPQRRVAVNLAPAELPMDGTGFDLTSPVPGTPGRRWRQRSRLEDRGDRCAAYALTPSQIRSVTTRTANASAAAT
jgi:hypothetical protein